MTTYSQFILNGSKLNQYIWIAKKLFSNHLTWEILKVANSNSYNLDGNI